MIEGGGTDLLLRSADAFVHGSSAQLHATNRSTRILAAREYLLVCSHFSLPVVVGRWMPSGLVGWLSAEQRPTCQSPQHPSTLECRPSPATFTSIRGCPTTTHAHLSFFSPVSLCTAF
jgi:hypothetical protein